MKKIIGISVEIQQGNFPNQLGTKGNGVSPDPQQQERQKEKKMILLIPAGKPRASDPFSRLGISLFQRLVGGTSWNSFPFCHIREKVTDPET